MIDCNGYDFVEPKADGWWCRCTFFEKGAIFSSLNCTSICERKKLSYEYPQQPTLYGEYLPKTPWGRAFSEANGGVEFLAFDLDHPGPYSHRRAALSELVARLGLPWLGELPTFPARNAMSVYRQFVDELGWEGVVLKKEETPPGGYAERHKHTDTWDFVITGIVDSSSPWRVGMIAGFEYGAYREGDLVPLGKVCAGLNHRLLTHAFDEPDKYLGEVIEIKGHSLTREGSVREPRFVRMRSALDKRPEDCLWQGGEGQ